MGQGMGCIAGPPWDLGQQQGLMWQWELSQPPATSRSLSQKVPKRPALEVISNLQGETLCSPKLGSQRRRSPDHAALLREDLGVSEKGAGGLGLQGQHAEGLLRDSWGLAA